MSGKTWAQRFKVTCEIEDKMAQFPELEHNVAVKVLKTMLHNYLMNATTYVAKELILNVRGDRPRKIIVNLHNDHNKRDEVIIRAIETEPEVDDKAAPELVSESESNDYDESK